MDEVTAEYQRSKDSAATLQSKVLSLKALKPENERLRKQLRTAEDAEQVTVNAVMSMLSHGGVSQYHLTLRMMCVIVDECRV